MALVGVELQMLVNEQDALTTRPLPQLLKLTQTDLVANLEQVESHLRANQVFDMTSLTEVHCSS